MLFDWYWSSEQLVVKFKFRFNAKAKYVKRYFIDDELFSRIVNIKRKMVNEIRSS